MATRRVDTYKDVIVGGFNPDDSNHYVASVDSDGLLSSLVYGNDGTNNVVLPINAYGEVAVGDEQANLGLFFIYTVLTSIANTVDGIAAGETDMLAHGGNRPLWAFPP